MKKRKKMIIGIAVAVVVVIVGILAVQNNAKVAAAMAQTAVETKELTTMNLANTVDVTGTVESMDSVKVYSPISTMQVKTVYVSVGDEVHAGDVLCELDTESLDRDIAQSEATIAASAATSQQQIESSEQKYDNAVGNLNNGLNSQVESAKTAVASAKSALDTAEGKLNTVKAGSEKAALDAAKTQLDAAQAAYNTAANNDLNGINAAQSAVSQAQAALDAMDPADPNYAAQQAVLASAQTQLATVTATANTAISQAQAALGTAQASYNTALAAYNAIAAPLETAVNSAWNAYNQALKQQDIVVNAANQEIETIEGSVKSSELASNNESQKIALEKLKNQKEQSVIKAPMDGTVTAVNAVEGSLPSGVLFKVENTKGLQIATTIKEYDINSVKTGMPATIQADGTGDAVYEGKLKSIAPAAVSNTSTSVQSATTTTGSSNVEFDAVVDVTSQDTGLLIGMNARVSIVLEEKENVLAVPYDAVTEDEAGQKIVYIKETDEKGNAAFRKINVETGLETDFYIEVSGKDLKEGMQIVANPDSIPAAGGAGPVVNK